MTIYYLFFCFISLYFLKSLVDCLLILSDNFCATLHPLILTQTAAFKFPGNPCGFSSLHLAFL